MHRYFVSFVTRTTRGDFSFGNTQVKRDKPLLDYADIKDVEMDLRNTLDKDSVIVLAIQPLGGGATLDPEPSPSAGSTPPIPTPSRGS